MKTFELNFTDTSSDWYYKIKKYLNINKIIYTEEDIINIVTSVENLIISYLKSQYYRPKNLVSYRRNLSKKLKRYGLRVKIKSNKLLYGLILNPNTNIYTSGFNINLIIDNLEIATKDLIFVKVKGC